MPKRLPLDRDPADLADDELGHHLRLLAAELTAAGMSSEAARREAFRRFGDPRRIRAEVAAIDRGRDRDRRRAGWWSALIQDARYALRTLRRTPGYTLITILSLAIAIGAASTMLSTVDAIDRRALRFPDGDRLLSVVPLTSATNLGCARCPTGVSFAELERWRQSVRSVDRLEGWFNATRVWHHQGETELVSVGEATLGVLPLFGVKPIAGREFDPGDARPGAALVAVVIEEFWRTRLGGDPGVVGSTIWLAPRDYERARPPYAYTVIGVVPAIPGIATSAEGVNQFWTMVPASPDLRPDRQAMVAIARTRAAGGFEDSQREFDLAARTSPTGLELGYSGARVVPLRGALLAEFRPVRTRFVLLGVVGLVLALAVVNVANLSLARVSRRRAELAVRASLGAGRGRLLRQLLAESVVVALAGGAVGAVFAVGGTALVSGRLRLPLLGVTAEVDWPILGASLVVSLLTGVLFGLAPAVALSGTDARVALGAVARGSRQSVNRRVEGVLVVAQVALAMVLIAGAGLLGTEVARLQRDLVGFDPRGLYQVGVPSPEGARRDPIASRALADQLAEQLAALPGFVATTVFTGVTVTAVRAPGGGEAPEPIVVDVEPNFFRTLGAILVRGRDFTAADEDLPVAIVTPFTARRLWPGRDPIGQRLEVVTSAGAAPASVIGVVAEAKWISTLRVDQAVVYRPRTAHPGRGVVALVRAAVPGADRVTELARAVGEVAGIALPTNEVRSHDEFIGTQLEGPGFNAMVVAGFATMALLLAAMGVSGVVALMVGARTREIGIRVALGARSLAILALVGRRAAGLAVLGIVAGLAGGAGLSGVLRSMLFATDPTDPRIVACAAMVLAVIAAVAALVPARRAVRLDPTTVLKEE